MDACTPGPGDEEYRTGVTALAVLAFLGAGYSHLSKDVYDGACFGDVLRRGLQWLLAQQDAEGRVGPASAGKPLYNHAIAALALSEAYGLTGSPLFVENAQRAIDFLVAAQNAGKGWRYSPRSGESDTSVTGWAVMALKSAELSGLRFPRSAYAGALAWLDEASLESDGRAGYLGLPGGKVFIPGMNESFDSHETTTAIGIMSRILITRSTNFGRIPNANGILMEDLPRWQGPAIDFYYWYCGTLAIFQ